MALHYTAVTLTTLILWMGIPDAITLSRPTNHLAVYAIPVGQGDCTVIQCPKPSGNIVLMDCGTSSAGKNQYYPNDVMNFLGKEIDNVVAVMITHPDRDHFSYIPTIMCNADKLRAVIIGGNLNDYNKYNQQFQDIRNFLEGANKNGKLCTINNGQKCIGNNNCVVGDLCTNFCDNKNIKFQILAANVGSTSNQKSIVMKVVVGHWSMLLSGDMEGAAANEIARVLGPQLRSTVYKMSHHGASSQANQMNWLTTIQPKYAFASSAYNHGNNRHPRCDAINRLLNLGSIANAPGHAFYCGNNGYPTIINNFRWHIYETSPRSNKMCLLAYYSNGDSIRKCTIVRLDHI